jgi:hypothetical protein
MPRQLLSPDQRATLLAAYPTTTNAELARQYGLTERQLVYIAAAAGVRKNAAALRRTHQRYGIHVQQQLASLRWALARVGADGLSWSNACAVLSGSCEDAVSKRLALLVRDGQAHRAGTHGRLRWFAEAAWAEAYAARPFITAKAQRSEAAREAREARTKARQERLQQKPKQRRAQPVAPAPVAVSDRGPAFAPGAPRIPEGLQVQHGAPVPGPEARWHSNAKPLLRRSGPGVYTDEPSSWVLAVTAAQKVTR